MSRLTGYEFLDDLKIFNNSPYKTATWLKTDFENCVWQIQTSQKKPILLDWRIPLWNGSLLTSTENLILINSLKHLMIIATDGASGEFCNLAPETKNIRLRCCMRAIDYLLIHSRSLKLVEHGLAALDVDSLKGILNTLASNPSSEDSIYDWHNRVSNFCKDLLGDLSEYDIKNMLSKHPAMEVVTDAQLEDFKLEISIKDIPKIRVALMSSGFFIKTEGYGLAVNTRKLSELLYTDTLRGKDTQKPALHALTFFLNEPTHRREYPTVTVTTGAAEHLQIDYYLYYRNFFLCISALGKLGLPAPADLDIIANYIPPTANAARFKSVPSKNLLTLFRKSIEFHISHGRKILNGFIRVAAHCHERNIPMLHLSNEELLKIIGPDLSQLGVRALGLSNLLKTLDGCNRVRKPQKVLYYKRLRANYGLIELIHVYIGAVEIIVGTIMARRMDELVTLKSADCLDITKAWLKFNMAKSTRKALGLRQIESRPIDSIAAEMIGELIRFQKILKRLGVIDELTDLFASPLITGRRGLKGISRYRYYRHLDFACDYFESEVTTSGQRYYIRQHQLRRFFAIMFFYTNTFGDLDTLRWMLGHRDIEHVWRYLTECLTPKDIQGASARYFADLAKLGRLENYQNLQDLLFAEFGTSKFNLVNEEHIEEYLVGMLEEGKVRIEPHFFNDENGKSLRVLFIVC